MPAGRGARPRFDPIRPPADRPLAGGGQRRLLRRRAGLDGAHRPDLELRDRGPARHPDAARGRRSQVRMERPGLLAAAERLAGLVDEPDRRAARLAHHRAVRHRQDRTAAQRVARHLHARCRPCRGLFRVDLAVRAEPALHRHRRDPGGARRVPPRPLGLPPNQLLHRPQATDDPASAGVQRRLPHQPTVHPGGAPAHGRSPTRRVSALPDPGVLRRLRRLHPEQGQGVGRPVRAGLPCLPHRRLPAREPERQPERTPAPRCHEPAQRLRGSVRQAAGRQPPAAAALRCDGRAAGLSSRCQRRVPGGPAGPAVHRAQLRRARPAAAPPDRCRHARHIQPSHPQSARRGRRPDRQLRGARRTLSPGHGPGRRRGGRVRLRSAHSRRGDDRQAAGERSLHVDRERPPARRPPVPGAGRREPGAGGPRHAPPDRAGRHRGPRPAGERLAVPSR